MPTTGTWLPISQGWNASPFAGTLPQTLYRYRSLSNDWVEKRLEFEVLDEAVYLAGADDLNDPEEGRVRWKAQGSFDVALKVVVKTLLEENRNANPTDLIARASEIARRMVDNSSIPKGTVDQMSSILGKLVRIACFTTRPLNGPMWTHYGNFSDGNGSITPHGGLCIEYSIDESWRRAGLRPVEYREKRPEINMLERETLEAQFEYASRVKSPDWAYEDEWRLVAYIDAKPPWPGNLTTNSKLKLEGSVRSVILGLNAKGTAVEKLIDIVRKKSSKIALRRVIRDESTAALILVPM